ncbi:MAG: hypothetical protein GY774_39185 [Planctomycetes bacterium]|nr:hypothetical protein [Planctomycetota bacterium]
MNEYNDEMGYDTWLDMVAICAEERGQPANPDGLDSEAAFNDGISPERFMDMVEEHYGS